MFANYLKIAWYNIRRFKIYSLINVLGIAVGLSGCIVIYLVASHELSFDHFHPDGERIYRITSQTGSGKLRARIPPPAPDAHFLPDDKRCYCQSGRKFEKRIKYVL